MLYQKMDENGAILESKIIDQSKMTSDCWLIQFSGLSACNTCEVRGTDECGGGKTLQRLSK